MAVFRLNWTLQSVEINQSINQWLEASYHWLTAVLNKWGLSEFFLEWVWRGISDAFSSRGWEQRWRKTCPSCPTSHSTCACAQIITRCVQNSRKSEATPYAEFTPVTCYSRQTVSLCSLRRTSSWAGDEILNRVGFKASLALLFLLRRTMQPWHLWAGLMGHAH